MTNAEPNNHTLEGDIIEIQKKIKDLSTEDMNELDQRVVELSDDLEMLRGQIGRKTLRRSMEDTIDLLHGSIFEFCDLSINRQMDASKSEGAGQTVLRFEANESTRQKFHAYFEKNPAATMNVPVVTGSDFDADSGRLDTVKASLITQYHHNSEHPDLPIVVLTVKTVDGTPVSETMDLLHHTVGVSFMWSKADRENLANREEHLYKVLTQLSRALRMLHCQKDRRVESLSGGTD